MQTLERFARNLDWNLLHVFVAIFEEKGVTRAASRLGLSQPAVSNALKRLEEQTGAILVDRTLPYFCPTKVGDALYRECNEIYGTIIRIPTVVDSTPDRVSGHIKLAFMSHLKCPIIDETIADFFACNPESTLEITVATSADIVEMVKSKTVSAGICLKSAEPPGIDWTLLFREHFALFCGAKHRLAGRKDLKVADLAGENFISFPTDRLSGALEKYAEQRITSGLDPEPMGVSSNLEEVRRMIEAGLGIGPLPIHVVDHHIRNGTLWMLDIPDSRHLMDVHVATNPKVNLNRAEELFLKQLLQTTDGMDIAERTYPRPPAETG